MLRQHCCLADWLNFNELLFPGTLLTSQISRQLYLLPIKVRNVSIFQLIFWHEKIWETFTNPDHLIRFWPFLTSPLKFFMHCKILGLEQRSNMKRISCWSQIDSSQLNLTQTSCNSEIKSAVVNTLFRYIGKSLFYFSWKHFIPSVWPGSTRSNLPVLPCCTFLP